MEIDYEGKPLNFQKILRTLVKYKWTNISLVSIALLLGIIYYLTTQAIYETSGTIQIKSSSETTHVPVSDFFGNNVGIAPKLDTEIDILKSNRILKKTIKDIDGKVEYIENTGLKKNSLYHDAPFHVDHFLIYNPKIMGQTIKIVDLGNNKFKLKLKRSAIKSFLYKILRKKNKLDSFDKVYEYGKPVVNRDIAMLISKKGAFDPSYKYQFLIYSYDDIITKARKNLDIAPTSKESSILKITYSDNNPQRAKDFVNKLIDNYLNFSIELQSKKEGHKLKMINKQLDKTQDRLSLSENQLEKFKKQHNITNIDNQDNELIRRIGELEGEYDRINIDLKRIQTIYNSVKRGDFSAVSSLGADYPILITLLQDMNNLIIERGNLLGTFTTSHPDVKRINNNIFNIKNTIKNTIKNIKNQTLNTRRNLKTKLNELNNKLKEFPQLDKKLKNYERLFQVNSDIYNYLLQKQSEASIEKSIAIVDRHVIDYAKKPSKPKNLKLPFILVVSTFLGIILALIHSFLRMMFDTKIKTSDDIIKSTSIPVFANIPTIKKHKTDQLIKAPKSIASEAIRELRVHINNIANKNIDNKVIMVTSFESNEGKSLIASNLAISLAIIDKRTILLSMDLRNPTISSLFNLDNSVGISDILAGKINYKSTIWQHQKYNNLNIITAGHIPVNAAELIESKRTMTLIEELKKEYDYIIIDTPPISHYADAISLFKYSDINLFVLRANYSNIKDINRLENSIKKLDIKNSAIVINDIDENNIKSITPI